MIPYSRRVLKWICGDRVLRNLPKEPSTARPAEVMDPAHLLLRMKSGRGALVARKLSVVSKTLQHFTAFRVSLTHMLRNLHVRTELKGDKEMRDSWADFPPPMTTTGAFCVRPLTLCKIRSTFASNLEEWITIPRYWHLIADWGERQVGILGSLQPYNVKHELVTHSRSILRLGRKYHL